MPLIQNGSNGLLKELRIILLDYNHHILYHRENMFGMVKSSVKRSKCANYAT
jgi:2-hydroxy-3-keto-5-methylthiopentenyl-1-phosphate phosphatase